MLSRAGAAGAAFAAALAAGALGASAGEGAGLRQTSVELTFARAINDVRVEHGLEPLAPESALVTAAQAYSRRMLAEDRFGHAAEWWKRLERAGASGTRLGENLGYCAAKVCPHGSPDLLVERWLASPAHRANLLQPRFDHVGVGIAVGEFRGWKEVYVVTTDFDG